MKVVTVETRLLELGEESSPLLVATHLIAYLFRKSSGAVVGRWDEGRGVGEWFYTPDTKVMFESPRVGEVIYREGNRARFRSVVFRLGSVAAETEGDLCGVMRLVAKEEGVAAGPARRYVVHASFWPEAGVWFKAAIVEDAVWK